MREYWIVLVAMVAACAPAPADRRSSPKTPAAASSPDQPGALAQSWPEGVGPFVAVERLSGGDALLFRRDTLSLPARVAVVGFDSRATEVSLQDVRNQPCASRALLRVRGAPAGWSLALAPDGLQPLLIDAVEDLSPADSQRVVIRVQRALNALPDSGDAQEFHALPVVVRDAWLVHTRGGVLTVARGARLRNVEAASHEELRFVVFEGDQPRFVARTAGEEESVESWALLAALDTPQGALLAIAREGTHSLQLELVQRDTAGWRSIWRSDSITCNAKP